MFEAHVLHLLQRYLGEYVRGLSLEALKISVWQGDVVLKDLQLKAEALNALKLPITVKAGFLGSIRLRVPWNRLGKEPVVVLLDRIFILAEPVVDEQSHGDNDEEKKQEAKRRKIEEAELAMLEAKDKRTAPAAAEGGSWIGSLLATIVGNLKLSITNVHIRYEDAVSNPGHPFCAGITLAKLAAVTTDDAGMETFVASGALDRLRKAVELERLAIYHNPNSAPWKVPSKWEAMSPAEWSEVFEPGISGGPVESRPRPGLGEALPRVDWAFGRQYLLQPTGGKLRYLRQGKQDKRLPNEPFQRAVVVLDEVALTVSEAQYCDVVKMMDRVAEYRARSQYAGLRPRVAVREDPRAWWDFLYKGVVQSSTKLRRPMSWVAVKSSCEKRRRYISLYSSSLESGAAAGSKVQNQEIKDLDAQLEPEVIIVWRLLAHAQVETAKQREAAAERERLRNSHWWSWGWGSGENPEPGQESVEESTPKGLTAAEWAKINELLEIRRGSEGADDGASMDALNGMSFAVDVAMRRNAAQLVDEQGAQILQGAFEGFKVGMRFFQKTVEVHVKLDSYGLAAPEGTLVKSVRQEGRDGALTAKFVHAPSGEPSLDWCLSAGVAPCQVTLWKASLDRCVAFVQAGHAISPAISLETAAALESTLEAVRRGARERMTAVLENRLRFSIDLDIDAPKVAIPYSSREGSKVPQTQLILDFGHFTMRTDPEEHPEDLSIEELGMYSRFRVRASDISAWLVDGAYDWAQDKIEATSPDVATGSIGKHAREGMMLPVLDKCGLAASIHQVHIPHVLYPSTRIAARVPTLSFHFSPARYERLMAVLHMLFPIDQVAEPASKLEAPQLAFSKQDCAGKVQVLTWTGIGKTVAQWQPRYAIHSGMYLYILEGEASQTYMHYSSLFGKQVVSVPPSSVGGWEHVVAICDRGADLLKVSESIHSVVLRFDSADAVGAWTNSLTQAIYKTSAPMALTAVDDGGEPSGEEKEAEPVDVAMAKSLFFVGVLEELIISLNGRATIASHTSIDRWQETLILKMRAVGGKVELVKRLYDLSIGIGLHSLQIEDALYGHNGPHCTYIARSLLRKSAVQESPSSVTMPSLPKFPIKLPERRIIREENVGQDSDDDGFADALEDFAGSPDSMVSRRSGFHSPNFRDQLDDEAHDARRDGVPSFAHSGGLLPHAAKNSTQVEEDFVTMQIVIQQPDSPDYDRVDTQLAIQVATLEFFCNRPTVVALTEFGLDISSIQASMTALQQAAGAFGVGQVVFGLEGRGKVRTIFQLLLDMETARVYLNLEDGNQLAVLAEERIHMDLKVFPSSIRIVASLGNLRIADLTLPPEHQYSWACDIRDPSSSSLVELQFDSFSKEDDDYAGYEYGLSGKLQAVRLVFLYRFIQELMEYFQALATPDSGKVVQIVEDAGVERLVKQSELDGAMALKLDIIADAPIIKMPKNSNSNEFMQLDLGHLELSNRFEWRGGGQDEPSAVRLDVMQIQGQDLQFVVGIDGKVGRPMFEEVQGVTVTIKRPLRDLFRRLPEVETDVQIRKLRAVLSDKEYHVILACAASNIAEPKHAIPTFRTTTSTSGLSVEDITTVVDASDDGAHPREGLLVEEEAEPSHRTLWTTNRVVVGVEHAELELFIGLERDASLASLLIHDLWHVYRSTSAGDQDVLLTLPRFTVVDNRPNTKSEMRFVVGSAVDVDSRGMPVTEGWLETGGSPKSTTHILKSEEQPRLTMLVLDYKSTKNNRSIILRTQKPRLLVSLDFLLAVADFFIPSFHASGGTAQSSEDDPIGMQGNIRLGVPEYVQEVSDAWLSPEHQLEVDAAHVSEFVYDGKGGSLYLLVEEGGRVVAGLPPTPLILIGNGKRLRFKNVHIKGGVHLDACIHLGADSSYSASPEDGCVIEDAVEGSAIEQQGAKAEEEKMLGSSSSSKAQGVNHASLGIGLDFQAVGLELTFYDTTKWPVGSVLRPEKLLRARMDFSCGFHSQGEDQQTTAALKGMRLEGGSGLTVVDPFDIQVEYSKESGKQDFILVVSSITVRMTGNILRLLQRLQADLVTTFHLGGDQVATRCTQFDRVWSNETSCIPGPQVAFWRPRAPPGYAIVGDCATSGVAPPSQSVLALSMAYERIKRPIAYELVWSSHGVLEGDSTLKEGEESQPIILSEALARECRLWLPVAPPGYVAVGCIAWKGKAPPPLSLAACIRMDLLTSSSFSDCIFYSNSQPRAQAPNQCSSIWRIENAFGSFMAHAAVLQPPLSIAYDLREFLRYSHLVPNPAPSLSLGPGDAQTNVSPGVGKRLDMQASVRGKLESVLSKAGKYYSSVAHFERMWWDKGSDARKHVSIWRPVVSTGYAMLGDFVTDGYEPPVGGLVMRDDGTGRLARPLGFKARAHLVGRNIEEASLWLPVAPPGYVALGCVAARGFNPPDPDCMRCVRMDLVNQAHFHARPVWESPGKPGKDASSCSFWRVENQAGTFMVRSDLKPPPWRMAFGLAELGKPKLPENISMEVKTGRISVTAFDDFSGLMNPLADISVSGTNLLAHGRLELMNAVMITSMAASTFNSQLDAWEPVVEPWEGLVKWESNNDPSEQALPAGARLRIAASSVLNINVNSSAVEMIVGAQTAWKRNTELEEEAKKELQLALADDDDASSTPVVVEGSSALDQDDFARVTMENKLGTTVFVQAVDTNYLSTQTLPAGECAVIRLPPPRFPELYTAGFTCQDENRPQRRFMAVRLLGGVDLPSGAGVCDLEYMCVLRVQTTLHSRKGRDAKTLPQSARTRCVRPSAEEDGHKVVRWEEVFLFEFPVAGKSEVELTVLSQAANAGQGELVGAAIVSMSSAKDVEEGKWNLIREHIDVRKGMNWPDMEVQSAPLYVLGNHERTLVGGHIDFAQTFFKYSGSGGGDETDGLLQRSVQLGLSSDGPWTGLRSVLALATYPERLGDTHFAVDVVLKQGLKFVELRSLVLLTNELDCPLEVCICPRALLDQVDVAGDSPVDGLAVVVEEQFENQRYQPIRGWGSKWPGNFVLGDPARWSTGDGLQSSQEFANVALPPGWEWTSDWHVDKVGYVDIDGWAYNMDFKSLRWPPPTVKSRKKGPFDFVRRRRWIRTRRRVSEESGGTRLGVGILSSGDTISMPWSSLQSGSDYCVQVRPQPHAGAMAWHTWGRPVAKSEPLRDEDSPGGSSVAGSNVLLRHVSGGLARLGSGTSLGPKDGVPANVFQLRSLSKTEELLLCNPVKRAGEAPHGPGWLSMEADASVMYNEINNPVYDWHLTVAAPLTLCNLLPVRAEYQVWEKPKRMAPVLRQRGVVESGADVQISSADIRRPIFLSWWPQGGWKPERDLVLISDPTRLEAELPNNFIVSNTRSNRKLRISVEHDLGDTDVAAKRVRLYVPYWLKNEAKVPLAYRLTEIDDPGKASKVTKRSGLSQPIRSSSESLQRVVKNLEDIEDQHGLPIMLNLPNSERVGLAVSMANNGVFSTAIPFKAFEDQLDRIDLNAVDASGVYCKLSASVEMSSYGYERTKVVRLQPHTVFTNRLGQVLYLKQHGVAEEDMLGPAEVAKPLLWRSIHEQELVQVRTDSTRWSQPFSLGAEGMMHITLRSAADGARQMIRAEIRNGVADSRFSVVFRACSAHGPYKVENRSMVLPIRFRQKGSGDSSWAILWPGSSSSFNWEDLLRERMVEVLVDGADPSTIRAYGLDQVAEYPPLASTRGPVAALHASVYREGASMVLRVEDWKPSTGDLAIVSRTPSFAGVGASSRSLDVAGLPERADAEVGKETELHMILDIHDLGVSIIDHSPEELLFVAIQGANVSYSTGLAGGITRFELHVGALQVDNQLALTPMPVLMALEEGPSGVRPDSVLKLTLSMQASADHVQNYPYIGVQFTKSAWLLNVHEPLLWRLVEMVSRLKLGRLMEEQSTAVTVDPRVHIGLLNMTDLHFKLTLLIAPAQRPRGILGFWSTLVTSIGNTNEMQLNFQGRVREDIHMRYSQLVQSMMRGVRNDLLGQPFHLLTGLDILGNLSSMVGTLSKGAAALSMDKKFIRSRQRQETKAGVEDLGDGLREGGEAFAKGLFRGVTGILTKPVEGYKAGGFEGFASGFARGVIGAAAQPMSGVLDLVSKTTDGFNAQGRKISAAITSEQVLTRTRLPRAIGGDNVVRPYDDYKARGQMMMQLAECGTYFGQYDIFKERAKFATSDAYEDHFNLPKNRSLIITHRRVLLLQHPTLLTGKRPDLMKEACSIMWHVAWEDLMTLEVLHSKHDPPGAPHSRVVLHLRTWSQDARLFDTKEIARVVKCHPGTTEAAKIRAAIQHAYDTYGPDRAAIAELTSRRRAARKPYAGTGTGAVSGAALGLLAGPAAPIAVPIMATFGAIVGGAGQAILQADAAQEEDKRGASLHHQQSTTGHHRSSSTAGGQHRRQISSEFYSRSGKVDGGAARMDLNRAACRLVRHFRLMWWDKGAAWSKTFPVSIWRPIVPDGYVVLGDVVQRGYDAPKVAMVYMDDPTRQFAQPEGYDLIWRDTDSGAQEPVTIWRPRAPSGYVAMGCVAVPDYYEPDRSIVRCVRQECTIPARLGEEPTWRDHKGAALWQCSLWQVDNQARTFLARRDHQRPNEEAALAVRTVEPSQA